MASWFDSVTQSLGNFVSGHGLEDNAQRAMIDAQNEKKRRDEQQQQRTISQPIVRQQPIQQPQTPNSLLSVPSFNDPFTKPTIPIGQPIPQATINSYSPDTKSLAQIYNANPQDPRVSHIDPKIFGYAPDNTITVTNNSALTGAPITPNAMISKPPVAQVQVQPTQPNVFQKIGSSIGQGLNNVGKFVSGIGPAIDKWNTDTNATVNNNLRNNVAAQTIAGMPDAAVKLAQSFPNAAVDYFKGVGGVITDMTNPVPSIMNTIQQAQLGQKSSALNNTGLVQDQIDYINSEAQKGTISQEKADAMTSKLISDSNKATSDLSNAEKKAGVKYDQSAGAMSLLQSAAILSGDAAITKMLVNVAPEIAAKVVGGTSLKKYGITNNISKELQSAVTNNDVEAFRTTVAKVKDKNMYDALMKVADNQEMSNATRTATSIPSTTSPAINNVLPMAPTTSVTPTVPNIVQPTSVAPQVSTSPAATTPINGPQLSLPENTLTTPVVNNVLKSDGPGGFVTKTPQQVAETTKAIGELKKIDTKLNAIRQGKTNNIEAPEIRTLMKQRSELLSVITGDKPVQDLAATQVSKSGDMSGGYTDINGNPVPNPTLDTIELGNPGAVPTDGTITSNPTNADLSNIIDNTQNPTTPKAPKIKLTPQNEMGDISQKPADNFTGELGVNKNGQIYQKVDQATAKDTALKNLLDGKTPEEYLATAQQTGQADSAELAILMQQVPKDSQIWAELASLKGKLGTQKGQALALLEKTMRQSATSEQLASRTLQKANTAGFDTTQIAGEISNINKRFTDARDAYNAVLNTTGSTNAEIQAAKDAFYKVTKQSFTDESNVLSKLAKTKEQKNFAYQLQKKSDVYLQGMATSSLTSSPASVMRNFAQGVGALTHQAGLAPKVEALINRVGGGDKIGSFNAAGAKVGLKTGASNLKSEFATRSSQLGLTKNPLSWVRHPIGTIRQLTTTGTELGNIPMEAGIRGGMSSEYNQILKAQGYKGAELKTLTERNTITDPLNIRDKYAKEINDLNGLSSEVDRTGGTFRENIKKGFIKLGVTDKTAYQLADFIDRDIFGFFKPTLIVGKKTADYATGGVAHLVTAIFKGTRGDKAGFVNEISKFISTVGVTLPVLGATGYALAKSGLLTQNEYGEWEVNGVPISGYVGAFGGPLAMGAIVGQNLRDNNGDWNHAGDGFADKAYKTITNTYPYGQAGQKLGAAADVIGGVFGDIANGQQAYGFKEGVASLLGGLGKESIPASSFLNWINKMLGGNVKDTVVDNPKGATTLDAGVAGVKQAGNQVINGLPVVSNSLPDKKNSFGDTMQKPGPLEAFLGASNDSIAQSDKATGITAVGSKGLNKVAKTNLTSEEEKVAYNDVVKRLEDNGDSVSDTNVFKEFVKDKNYILAAKYDSNINKTINDADKTALVKYDALDSDHQKVYIQDQQNALNVYNAQLNNKQANGTLTDDDKKTYKVWSGSGNSLLINSLVAKTNVENNVTVDTLDLYEQVTTQKEYDNLPSDQRAKLDQYAAQLQKNGVKVRSFLLGGGSSSGAKAKGASSMSLTKAVTSGGGVGGKFAHQDINVDIPQVVKPAPQYVIKQRKISVG